MIVSFSSLSSSTNLSNTVKTTVAATTTAVNAVVLTQNQYLHVQNEAASVAWIATGTAAANAATATNYFWRIPANSDVYFDEIPIGQINVRLASGTGNIHFVVADRS